MTKIIKSISYNQTEIISNIIKLHVPQGFIDLDCTYSKGHFYKNTNIIEPIYKFDLFPQTLDTIAASADSLPLADSIVECVMFDPPFLATTGKSLLIDDGNNKINKRFGVFPTELKLHEFYVNATKEIHRILKDDGILIFKCQDKVSSSKQYMSHCFVYNTAVENGFYPKDLFILLAKNRLVANWQLENQKNSRKFHSYFWVFQKSKKNIRYV